MCVCWGGGGFQAPPLYETLNVYVLCNLRICAILRLHCPFSESSDCVLVLRLRKLRLHNLEAQPILHVEKGAVDQTEPALLDPKLGAIRFSHRIIPQRSDDLLYLLPLLSCYGLARSAAILSVSLGTKHLKNLPSCELHNSLSSIQAKFKVRRLHTCVTQLQSQDQNAILGLECNLGIRMKSWDQNAISGLECNLRIPRIRITISTSSDCTEHDKLSHIATFQPALRITLLSVQQLFIRTYLLQRNGPHHTQSSFPIS